MITVRRICCMPRGGEPEEAGGGHGRFKDSIQVLVIQEPAVGPRRVQPVQHAAGRAMAWAACRRACGGGGRRRRRLRRRRRQQRRNRSLTPAAVAPTATRYIALQSCVRRTLFAGPARRPICVLRINLRPPQTLECDVPLGRTSGAVMYSWEPADSVGAG